MFVSRGSWPSSRMLRGVWDAVTSSRSWHRFIIACTVLGILDTQNRLKDRAILDISCDLICPLSRYRSQGRAWEFIRTRLRFTRRTRSCIPRLLRSSSASAASFANLLIGVLIIIGFPPTPRFLVKVRTYRHVGPNHFIAGLRSDAFAHAPCDQR